MLSKKIPQYPYFKLLLCYNYVSLFATVTGYTSFEGVLASCVSSNVCTAHVTGTEGGCFNAINGSLKQSPLKQSPTNC